MTLEEKQLIAATARKLIRLLDNCDDDKFVDFVLDCVTGNLDYLLEVDKFQKRMENIRYCPLCGKDMNSNDIHLCGGTPTLIHTCISGIQIKIQADTVSEVARKWNTFVAVANK